jgi:hypothetical protein
LMKRLSFYLSIIVVQSLCKLNMTANSLTFKKSNVFFV